MLHEPVATAHQRLGPLYAPRERRAPQYPRGYAVLYCKIEASHAAQQITRQHAFTGFSY
jgi:hypothetical protein